ncbi:hypothetical protein [Nonomuraea dietziae]|uniref:hypothetical protein n=1 Tax=Nonomuraea dietziae TaxID=65515 RepID=UPI0033FDB309
MRCLSRPWARVGRHFGAGDNRWAVVHADDLGELGWRPHHPSLLEELKQGG